MRFGIQKLVLVSALFIGLSFTSRPLDKPYCTTNLYTVSCALGDDLDDVSIGSFTQNNTGCSANGYADYTADTVMIAQADPTQLSITSSYNTQWYALWIDFNGDGDFDDADEFIWNSSVASGNAGTTTTASIILDTATPIGTFRMRLRGKYAGSAITAGQSCASFYSGEVHDYTVQVLPPLACPAPYSLSVSGLTATTASIAWAGLGTQFNIAYGQVGFLPGSGNSVSSNTTSVTVSNLTPNTTYDVYVQNNCSSAGNGNSLWAGPLTFTTRCSAISTYPFIEDFDDSTKWVPSTGLPYTSTIDNCWERNPGIASRFHWVCATGATPTSGTGPSGDTSPSGAKNYIYVEGSGSGQVAYLTLPAFNLSVLNVPFFSFYWHRYGAAMGPFTLQVSTDTGKSWMPVLTLTGPSQTTSGDPFLEETMDLSAYKSPHTMLRFKLTKLVGSTTDMAIDDVRMEEAPPCPSVSAITFKNSSPSSVDVAFLSSGTTFVVEYGPCGFMQGSGTVDTITTSSFTLNGLMANTSYDLYVQNVCTASSNGFSGWKHGGCFKTACAEQLTPLFENLNNTVIGSPINPSAPDCWSWNRTANGSFGYGYTSDIAGLAYSDSAFFYIFQSGLNDTLALISPKIAGIDTTDMHITFWARGRYSGALYDEQIIVATMSDPEDLSTLNNIDTVRISGSAYQYFDVYLDAASGYNGTDRYIALVMNTGSKTFGYACIDNIVVAEIPVCKPSIGLTANSITNNSALLSWTSGDGLSSSIEYGPAGFVQGTGNPIISGISGTSRTISGLLANTCYDVYIGDSCTSGMSPWFGPITFCTACDPFVTPFTEGFDSIAAPGTSADPGLPGCWSYWRNGTFYGHTESAFGPIGSYHWRFYNFSGTDTVALISPMIDSLPSGNKQIKFWNKSHFASPAFQGIAMEVGTTPTPADLRLATAIDTVYGDYGQAYSNAFTVFLDTASGYNSSDRYVYMRPLFEAGKWYAYHFVDDITVEDIPACTPPWNLNTSSVTGNTAQITWSTLQGTGFQIEYGPVGFIPGTGASTTLNNVSSGVTISGLTPNTEYAVYVADQCDTTQLAGPIVFKTGCANQLSGMYTVAGPSANFATLDSAIGALTGCGISGPTTLMLTASDTAMPFVLGQISGVNDSNQLTIKGSTAAGTDTMYLAGFSSVGIALDGASYITFKDLSIIADSVNYLVWMHNATNYITFENCNLILPKSGSTASGIIVGSSSALSVSGSGNNANNITIINCMLQGGGYGASFYGGNASTRNINLNILGNTFRNGYCGVRINFYAGISVSNNNINTSGPYGMYLYYPRNFAVKGNNTFAEDYALYTYRPNDSSTGTTNSRVENNFFGSEKAFGIYGGYCESVSFVHNSVRGKVNGCQFFGSLENCTFINNIFVGRSGYAFENASAAANTSNNLLDYNLYHSEAGANMAHWAGTDFASLSAWQTADTTLNQNALEGDPNFRSNTDFHIIGTLPNDAANGSTNVLNDIDGDVRPAFGSTQKDIGADEFTPLQWDVALESIDLKQSGCGDSATEVYVTVKNLGESAITALPIVVEISGGLSATLNYTSTDTIASRQSKSLLVGTFNTYNGANGVFLTAFTALPNDQRTSNDTILDIGPAEYASYEPQFFASDSVCVGADSATLAAIGQRGVLHAWYANATDSVPEAVGDTFAFALASQTTWHLGYLDNADSLGTTFAAGSGQNGNMFDINVKTGLTISGFTIHAQDVDSVEVWYRPGSYLGFENNPAGWTKLTAVALPVAGSGAQHIALPLPLTLNSGTHAFYITMLSETLHYSNGTSIGAVYSSNSDLDIHEGIGKIYPFGTSFSPRIWNGRIHYGAVGCSDVKQTLTVGLKTDTALAVFSYAVQSNGADVEFDASASVGQVYEWAFGDGAMAVTNSPVTSHTYASGGTYTACLKVTDTVCRTSDSICQPVNATVSLIENALNQSLTIFPNPNTGLFRIAFQLNHETEVELRLISLLGQELNRMKLGRVSGAYTQAIDLNSQAAGVYILQVITDKQVAIKELTIQR